MITFNYKEKHTKQSFIHKSGVIARTKTEFCCGVKSSTTERCIRSDRQEVELVVRIYRNKKRVLAAERNRGVAISSVWFSRLQGNPVQKPYNNLVFEEKMKMKIR